MSTYTSTKYILHTCILPMAIIYLQTATTAQNIVYLKMTLPNQTRTSIGTEYRR